MFLDTKVIQEIEAALGVDARAFLPELILCGTIVLLLLLRLFRAFDHRHLGGAALVLTLAALVVSWAQWRGYPSLDPRTDPGSDPLRREMFSGMLVYDNFTIFLRLFLLGFASLIIWLTLLTGIPDREDSADFYCLLLGATLGMSLMASANHLLMVYIGVEMASLPSYALAGFLKGRRQSSEAALKYVVYGGGASGIMLYGISLLAGKFGTAYLPDLALVFGTALQTGPAFDPVLVLGTLFILIGIAFKLAAVPFHFWCPDVFEGAAAEVAGFLSVASKGAALALLGRLVLVLVHPAGVPAESAVIDYLIPVLALFAAVTATFGNLAAYAQTNLKRLLAYSTIAHAGYMMMGLATLKAYGAAAVLSYLVVYLFMNLGAFAVVAFLRNLTGSEELPSFRGLVYRAPVLVVTLGVFLLSLLGIPPLAGFFAKFEVFKALFKAAGDYGYDSGRGMTMLALLVIGGINTVISLVYYIMVLKVMILDKPLEEVEGREPQPLHVPPWSAAYATLLALVIVVLGVFWDPLVKASNDRGVKGFGETTARSHREAPARAALRGSP
jgi:NADH-quinone oxidoreductase subunit N